jgi:hypothetical protein
LQDSNNNDSKVNDSLQNSNERTGGIANSTNHKSYIQTSFFLDSNSNDYKKLVAL